MKRFFGMMGFTVSLMTGYLTQACASAPLLFDYTIKNPQYEDHMPYNTIHGIMGQDGKIIIPAKYDAIDLKKENDQWIFYAFNAYGKHEDVIHRFDITGKALEPIKNTNAWTDTTHIHKPRYMLDMIEIDDKQKEHIETRMEFLFETHKHQHRQYYKKQISEQYDGVQLSDDVNEEIDKRLAKQILFLVALEHSYLLDTATGQKTPLVGKNISHIEFNYFANEQKNGLIAAQEFMTGRWGFIDGQANWAIAPTFYKPDRSFDENQFLAEINNDNILGVVTKKEYDECFSLIDNKGTLLAEFNRYPKPFHNGYAVAKTCDDSQSGVIDNQGNWLFTLPKHLSIISRTNDDNGYLLIKDNQTHGEGVINTKGEIIIEPKFEFINDKTPPIFDKQGLIAVHQPHPDYYARRSAYGFMNKQGGWQIPPTLPTKPSIKTAIDSDMMNIIGAGNSYAFDEHGFAYSYMATDCGVCRYAIDIHGNIALPQLQGILGNFNSRGYAPYIAKGSHAMQIVDKQGNAVTTAKYVNKHSYLYDYNVFSLADKPDLVGVMNDKGDELIPPLYQEIATYDDYAIITTANGLYGVLNYQNQWIIKPQPLRLNPISADVIISAVDFGL